MIERREANMEKTLKNILIVSLLILAAVISCLFIADKAASPETHVKTIRAIDEKTQTVLKLTATSTLASAAISALPDDAATPIAEKLADFTEYFLLILVVLYTEKYMITILGAAAFRILIPVAFGLFGVGLFWNPRVMKKISLKLAVFALAVYFVIPASINVSELIYKSYSDSINTTITSAEELANSAEESSGKTESSSSSFFQKIQEAATSVAGRASQVLNRFVEALAVMIVTTCIIPILVLVFFLWLIRQLTGIDVSALMSRRKKNAVQD